MTGDTIVRLVAAMEAHPKVALIQTLPDHRQCAIAVRPLAAIRRAIVRTDDRGGHRVVARLRGQLLGPQRHHSRPRLCARCGAARTQGPQAVRRAYHEPRLHRGGADAARRLGDPHGADASAAAYEECSADRFRISPPATGAGARAICSIWRCCRPAACTGSRGFIC